jgi:hypothetical protein
MPSCLRCNPSSKDEPTRPGEGFLPGPSFGDEAACRTAGEPPRADARREWAPPTKLTLASSFVS